MGDRRVERRADFVGVGLQLRGVRRSQLCDNSEQERERLYRD